MTPRDISFQDVSHLQEFAINKYMMLTEKSFQDQELWEAINTKTPLKSVNLEIFYLGEYYMYKYINEFPCQSS